MSLKSPLYGFGLTVLISLQSWGVALPFDNIDLTSILPQQIRNQGQSGNCFANAAADLLSVHYGQFVSASDVTISYMTSVDPVSLAFRRLFQGSTDEFSGGWPKKAMELSSQHGVCYDPNIDIGDSSKYSIGEPDFAWVAKLIEREKNESKQQILSEMKLAESEANGALFGDPLFVQIQETFPEVTSKQRDLIWAKSTSVINFVSLMRDQECEGRVFPPEQLKVRAFGMGIVVGGFTSLIDRLDEQLALKNPVALSIRPNFLIPPFYRHFFSNPFELHTVVAAGRQYRKGQWMYLIRNSWGTSCGGYSSEVECSVEHPGHFWVEREKLFENLTQIAYIEPSAP